MTDRVGRLPLWQLGLLVFGAMVGQDLLYTCMTVFEAHYRSGLAGAFDVVGWLFAQVTLVLSAKAAIQEGWLSRRSLTIIGSVSAANFLGTVLGVTTASILTRGHP